MRTMAWSAVAVVTAALGIPTGRADEEKVPLDKLPKAVAEAVQKRFPKVEMKSASKEKDGDKVVFEVTLKKDGKNIDVTVTEAGAITLIEQEVEFKDLPQAVKQTFEEKYPNAKYEIVESVTKAVGGKETLDYYEAKLVAADKKTWEVEVLPDGKLKAATEVKGGKKD
ncbi:MAG: PepSY-like domain-containing protein [Gemmataceae bacterium]|nr:PepSY-like domain-containing protein [Gemmataceae bacterium]